MSIEPRLHVTPPTALVDEEVAIAIDGLEPGREVELTARTHDEADIEWSSQASFVADEDGRIDLGRCAPVNGSWSSADPMAFLWSMKIAPDATRQRYVQTRLDPSVVELEASVAGTPVARGRLERRFVGEGVTRTDVRDEGMVATLYEAADPAGRATVMVIGGSAGGLENARLLHLQHYPGELWSPPETPQ